MQEIPDGTLFIDAGTPAMQVGVYGSGRWLSLETAEGDAISLLAPLAAKALKTAGRTLHEVRAFGFCEGPGALLGLRLSAMLVNSWLALPPHAGKPVVSYRLTQTAAAVLSLERQGESFRVATAVRRGTYACTDSATGEETLLSAEALALSATTLFTIAQRRMNGAPEPGTPLAHSLASLPEAFAKNPALLRSGTRAEVYAPLLSEYKLWEGERHRAPTGPA